MYLIFFFLTLLISNTFCFVYLGKNEEKTINPNIDQDRYFYLKLDEFKSCDAIYLTIKLYPGKLEEEIEITYINQDISKKYYTTESKKPYRITGSDMTKDYYYKLDYKNYDYSVINYNINIRYSNSKLILEANDYDPVKQFAILMLEIFGPILIVSSLALTYLCLRNKYYNSRYAASVQSLNSSQPDPIVPPESGIP